MTAEIVTGQEKGEGTGQKQIQGWREEKRPRQRRQDEVYSSQEQK